MTALAGISFALLRPQWAHYVNIPLLLSLFALGLCYYIPFTNDDALIFSRYAENLASGMGFVFNEGQRVEGATSMGWTLILAAFARSGLDVLISAKAMGGALTLVSLVFIYKGALIASKSQLAAFVSTFALAVNQLFLSWTGSGMDVALFFCWESSVLYSMLSGNTSPKRLAALSAAGFLVRPEAFLISAVLWAYMFFMAYRDRGVVKKDVLLYSAITAGLGACLFIFKKLYFGSFLPTTYYAKSYLGLTDGIRYLADSSRILGITFVVVSVSGLVLNARRWPFLLALLVAYAAYLVKVGGDVLAQRFALFLVPFLIMGFALSMRYLFRVRPFLQYALLCLFLAYFSMQGISYMKQAGVDYLGKSGNLYVPFNAKGTFGADYNAGRILARAARTGDRLLTDNIGAAGYYGGTQVIDTYGLVTPGIAEAIHNNDDRSIREMIKGTEAQWVLTNNDGYGHDWLALVGDISFLLDDNYVLVRSWIVETGYARNLYRRVQK